MPRIAFAVVIAALVALVALVAGGAAAGTLRAGPLVAAQHRCCVSNLGSSSVDVSIRLFDETGTDRAASDLCALRPPLEAGQTCCAQLSSEDRIAALCVIRASGPKRRLRGTLAAEVAGGEPSAVLEAR